MKRYLAIDFGLRHLGLAINYDSLAEPFGQISYRKDETALKKLVQICQKEGVEAIVVGISEGKMAQRTRGFARRLSEVIKLPVEFEDETLTTQEAKQRLIESGKGRVRRRQKDHQAAAALILQSFLDKQEQAC